MVKLFFDGGCRPNPGVIETAVVALGVVYHDAGVGQGSNNDAEWLAAIQALRIAARLGLDDLQLLGDSATVIEHANGARGSRDLAAHYAVFEELRGGFDRVRTRRVRRSQNLAGIYLAKLHSGR